MRSQVAVQVSLVTPADTVMHGTVSLPDINVAQPDLPGSRQFVP
jgi:hypothetical protein